MDKAYFDIITEKLVDRLIIIRNYRQKYVECINSKIEIIYKRIMKMGNLKVVYDKNISFEDLRLILGKITATKIDGKWTIAPIKKAVQKLAAKLEFQIDEFDLNALFAEEGTRPEPRT